MWNEESGSSIMSVLFIIIVIWAIFGGGFGGFGRGADGHTCGCVSNCEVQKQEIIDNARNLYAIETTGNRTIEANNANTQRLYEQSARQYEAGLQAELFDFKLGAMKTEILNGQALSSKDAKISELESRIYTDAKFDSVIAGQQALACELPKRPPYYAQGFVNCGQPIPQGFGGYGFQG